MLKLLGAVLTVLCALLYSAQKSSAAEQRIKKCKVLCKFICECSLRLECHARPIEEVVSELSSVTYADFAESVRREGFESAVGKFKGVLLDGEEERAMLAEFAEGFGRGHADREAVRCARYAEMLEKHTKKLEESAKTERKAHLAVSLCASLMAVLFFA